jgi:2-polyprenyl-3-methyl-5-hydroxy-6-metoxy-1,4-benzoquinol methylase
MADYLNISREYVQKLVNETASAYDNKDLCGIATQWRWMFGDRTGSTDEYRYFYATNFLYLFDLIGFAGCFDPNLGQIHKYAKGRCLDYGSGIGTVALWLREQPGISDVHAIDVAVTLNDFLRWRARKHGLDIVVLDPMDNSENKRLPHKSLRGQYDFIYARDVFEHACDRLEILQSLMEHTSPGGIICESSPIWDFEAICKQDIAIKDYDIWDLFKDKGFTLVTESRTPYIFAPVFTKCWRKP